MGDSAWALRSFRSGYLAPYFRTRMLLLKRACFASWLIDRGGLSNRGKMTWGRNDRLPCEEIKSLPFSLNNVSLGACRQWQVQKKQKKDYRSQATGAGQSSIEK